MRQIMGVNAITDREEQAACDAITSAPLTATKSEMIELTQQAVDRARNASGQWAVYAQSFDLPSHGHLVSLWPSEAAALMETWRLNQESQSDAGMYEARQAQWDSLTEVPANVQKVIDDTGGYWYRHTKGWVAGTADGPFLNDGGYSVLIEDPDLPIADDDGPFAEVL